jgi:hypothetical protein
VTALTAYLFQQFQLLAFRSRCGFPPWCPAFKLDYEIRGSERAPDTLRLLDEVNASVTGSRGFRQSRIIEMTHSWRSRGVVFPKQ